MFLYSPLHLVDIYRIEPSEADKGYAIAHPVHNCGVVGHRGQSGFIKMKRNVNKTGICGISQQASYPTVAKGSPLPSALSNFCFGVQSASVVR